MTYLNQPIHVNDCLTLEHDKSAHFKVKEIQDQNIVFQITYDQMPHCDHLFVTRLIHPTDRIAWTDEDHLCWKWNNQKKVAKTTQCAILKSVNQTLIMSWISKYDLFGNPFSLPLISIIYPSDYEKILIIAYFLRHLKRTQIASTCVIPKIGLTCSIPYYT